MAKYTFMCEQGHEPETLDVEADDDETAMTMMMEKAKAHLAEKHAGGPTMDDTQIEEMIRNGWHKEESPPQAV